MSKFNKKNKNKKAEINQYKFNKNNLQSLKKEDYIVKEITPDGNCFYRCLSYFYRQKENDYNEFRQLITNYIEQNIDYYLIFISDEEVNIKNEDGLSDDEIIKKKKDYLLKIYRKC